MSINRLAFEAQFHCITAWLDAGGRGMGAAHYKPYQELASKGELNVRAFWTTIRQPASPGEVDKVLAETRKTYPPPKPESK